MVDWWWLLIVGVVALLLGIVDTVVVYKLVPALKGKNADKQAKQIIRDAEIKAERIAKNAEIDAKQAAFEAKQNAQNEIRQMKQEVQADQNKLDLREQTIDARDNALLQKENALDQKSESLSAKIAETDKKSQDLDTKINSIITELEKVSGMSVKEAHEAIYPVKFFELDKEREELYLHAGERVDKMFADGLLEETVPLIEKYGRNAMAFKAIGVKELFPYLDGKASLEESKELIKKNTRHYIKNQYTWFRHQFPLISIRSVEDIIKALWAELMIGAFCSLAKRTWLC